MSQIKPLADCIFCQIATGKAPCFKVFENQETLAFLDIFPNTEGFSVVIPKEHYVSDFTQVPEAVVNSLLKSASFLAKKITAAYSDVGRCAVVIEGMMIDHLHAKVIPLHQTANKKPSELITEKTSKYFETYLGYISTKIMDQMADKDHLELVAQKINKVKIED